MAFTTKGFSFPAGKQLLSGDEALAFVRDDAAVARVGAALGDDTVADVIKSLDAGL
jgi:hypothetical protein